MVVGIALSRPQFQRELHSENRSESVTNPETVVSKPNNIAREALGQWMKARRADASSYGLRPDSSRYIKDFAHSFGIYDIQPFNQKEFFLKLFDDSPELYDQLGSTFMKGVCFGLSVKWLQSHMQGKNDQQFFNSLKDWENDSTFLTVQGIQHVEQKNMANDNTSLNSCANLVGLEVKTTKQGKHNTMAALANHKHFCRTFEKLNQGKTDSALWIHSSHHSMAMRQENNRLHFFDPNIGILSVDKDKSNDLYAAIHDLVSQFGEIWGEGNSDPNAIVMPKEIRALSLVELDKKPNHPAFQKIPATPLSVISLGLNNQIETDSDMESARSSFSSTSYDTASSSF